MKTSKWNLATLPCPLCPAPAPCLRPACPALCPSVSPGLGPGLVLPCPSLPLSSQKVAITMILRFSALENLKMESCNPALCALPLHPACALPALRPALPLALALALALCCPALPLPSLKMESCNPALPLHPACALPALHPAPGLGPGPVLPCPSLPLSFQKVAKT